MDFKYSQIKKNIEAVGIRVKKFLYRSFREMFCLIVNYQTFEEFVGKLVLAQHLNMACRKENGSTG